MDALYDYISFLPEAIQPIIVASFVIVVGYFLSKIFAAIIVSLIPAKSPSEEITNEDAMPLRIHLGRLIFWPSWLTFIVIGTNQVHSILPEFFQYISSPSNLMSMLPAALGACILIISEKYIAQIFKVLSEFYRSIPIHRDNSVARFIMRFSWIPLLAVFAVTLASPDTFGYNTTSTLLILLFGWLISTVLKQAVSSIINPLGLKNELIAKFVSYFVFVHFLVAAAKIWV